MNKVLAKVPSRHRKTPRIRQGNPVTLHLTQIMQRPEVLKKNHVQIVDEPQLLVLARRQRPEPAIHTITRFYAQRLR